MSSGATTPFGSLCLVLHGHLPYVLHHGTHPHGEAWLYEAAAETYLPLLEVVGEIALHKVRPALTIGLTPVLLEQLSHEHFKSGFSAYLRERADRARQDRKDFEQKGETQFAELADRWGRWYERALAQFESLGRDLPGQFAARCREGQVQLLTSNATHAYMPLLLNDQSIRAQLACGVATTRRHLGTPARGMWLPECAYRPTWEHWVPSVLYDDPRHRVGLEHFIAAAGVDHFFVDSHLVTEAMPLGVVEAGHLRPTSEPQTYWDQKRGWRSPLEPVGVASKAEPPKCYALARHPRVSEQVWSGIIGYPGSGEYLEFHRKHGEGGLRYHRVTDVKAGLHEKQPYAPEHVPGKMYEHTQHFCGVVRETLREHLQKTGRPGVCVAPFDAELFGHWWHEGPYFLRDVIYTLAHDKTVALTTAQEALERHPPDMVVRMPEGSWGKHGDHSVWINDQNRWMWEMEYRAENRMLKLLHELPWRADVRVREMLERAGRELLLLQASDWPFVVHSKGAVDYGIQRFAGHCTRFDRVTSIAEQLARGGEMSEVERVRVAEADAHDTVFPQIELGWWG